MRDCWEPLDRPLEGVDDDPLRLLTDDDLRGVEDPVVHPDLVSVAQDPGALVGPSLIVVGKSLRARRRRCLLAGLTATVACAPWRQ